MGAWVYSVGRPCAPGRAPGEVSSRACASPRIRVPLDHPPARRLHRRRRRRGARRLRVGPPPRAGGAARACGRRAGPVGPGLRAVARLHRAAGPHQPAPSAARPAARPARRGALRRDRPDPGAVATGRPRVRGRARLPGGQRCRRAGRGDGPLPRRPPARLVRRRGAGGEAAPGGPGGGLPAQVGRRRRRGGRRRRRARLGPAAAGPRPPGRGRLPSAHGGPRSPGRTRRRRAPLPRVRRNARRRARRRARRGDPQDLRLAPGGHRCRHRARGRDPGVGVTGRDTPCARAGRTRHGVVEQRWRPGGRLRTAAPSSWW